MKIHHSLLLVAGIAHAKVRVFNDAPKDTCTVYEKTNCDGNDITWSSCPDAATCCQRCADTPGCGGFTQDIFGPSGQRDPTCYLKTRCDDRSEDGNSVSGTVPLAPTPQPDPNQTCTLTEDVNCWGDDMGDSPCPDVATCCQRCADTPGCTAFTQGDFNGAGQKISTCYLKYKCDSPGADGNSVSGTVTGPPAPTMPPTPMPTPPPSNVYHPAAQCASDLMAAYPNLAKEWIYANGTFGGDNSAYFVGWVDNHDSSMPRVNMMDGPQGVRDILNGQNLATRTSWPAAATYGMAWSPEIAYFAGKVGARDWRAVEANTALTPGVNVHRVPTNGRNWEYVSGEDAHLGTIAAELTKGIQSDGMMATLKHFALNHQELNREGQIAQVDEETAMETYLRAFQPTIDAGVGSVMCSYNQVQFANDLDSHAYTCGSSQLLGLLRNEMGFAGALMTDWNAKMINTTHGQQRVARELVEWEMTWAIDIKEYVPLAAHGTIVRNALTGMFAAGILTNATIPSCGAANVKTPTDPPKFGHLPTAYQSIFKDVVKATPGDIAPALIAEAMVLLKNDAATLPLTKASPKILLAGTALLNGGGSGDSAAFGYDAPGHWGEGLFNGGRVAQDLMKSELGKALDADVVWDYEADKSATYDVVVAFGAQFRSEAYLVGNKDGYLNIDQCNSGKNFSQYGDCDYPSFLDQWADARSSGTKVISVTTTGGAHIAFDYLDKVDAALTLMYPGQHFAAALGNVLNGQVSPGGKLTYTLPDMEADGKHIQSPVGRFNSGLKYSGTGTKYMLNTPAFLWDAAAGAYSDVVQYDYGTSVYGEKGLVGYKYFEKYGMAPLFPFGFGLSFADFAVAPSFDKCKVHADGCNVDVKVSKSGGFAGIASEVVQLYLGFATGDADKDAMRPVRELRGFQKVWASGSVTLSLGADDFATKWDATHKRWVLPCQHGDPAGIFTVSVGTSSRDILGSTSFACVSPYTAPVDTVATGAGTNQFAKQRLPYSPRVQDRRPHDATVL